MLKLFVAEFPPSLQRAIPARRLSEGVPHAFQTGYARPSAGHNHGTTRRASQSETLKVEGKKPTGQIHLRVASLHRCAAKVGLVDHPHLDAKMATDKLRAFAKFALTSPPRSLITDDDDKADNDKSVRRVDFKKR